MFSSLHAEKLQDQERDFDTETKEIEKDAKKFLGIGIALFIIILIGGIILTCWPIIGVAVLIYCLLNSSFSNRLGCPQPTAGLTHWHFCLLFLTSLKYSLVTLAVRLCLFVVCL